MGWDGWGGTSSGWLNGGRKRRTKRASASSNGSRGKKRRKKATRRAKRSTTRSSSLSRARAKLKGGKRLKKGSAEAKAWMAKLRRMRK